LSPEFARNWSAVSHRFFSSGDVAMSFEVGATQGICQFPISFVSAIENSTPENTFNYSWHDKGVAYI
jgi:hypothetical protein